MPGVSGCRSIIVSAKPATEHVIGRYVLCGELASGGMATVHLGRMFGQAGFSRTVAIKRLHPQFAKDHDFAAMFVDEARLAARVSHPNVVATLDVEAMGDELFLVMEYVAGESLSRLVRLLSAKGETIPPAVVSSILAGALLGLHAAHEATAEDGTPLGIVHRDVSPQNIMVGADGTARVLDFGVAKAAVRAQVTRDGQIKGKVAYMPPEQLRSEPIDRRADVYGAAVVLWELLTMRRLFDGEHDAAVLMQALHAEVPPPSALVPGLPPAIDAVVLRGLARSAEDRFATARDMAAALEDALPPASPRKVGEWLSSVAGRVLEKRAQKVKEVESRRGAAPATDGRSPPAEASALAAVPDLPGAESRVLPVPIDGVSQVSTVAVTSATGRPLGRRTPWIGAVALVAVGAALAAAALWLSGSPPPGSAGPAAGSAAPPAEPSIAASSVPRSEAQSQVPSSAPSAVPSGESAASTAPSAPASASAAPITKKASGVKPPAGQGKASPSTGCNPPYTVDARGIRRMKPECL